MSLKAFHLLFIILSTLLSIGFGIWGLLTYRESGNTMDLAMTIAAFVVAFLLIVYGRFFLKKMKNVSYL